jgi:DNA-binding CsgD family transcriptional regulator
LDKTAHQFTRVIQATEQICSLPAIPTQTWATDVAKAIAVLSPTSIVGVLVAHLDPSSFSLNPITTGVSNSKRLDADSTSQAISQALYLQDKLERISSLGFQIPNQSCTRGLVAPISLLHEHWRTTPIGRVFSSQSFQSPIIAIIPISQAHPGFVLIITFASNADQSQLRQSSETREIERSVQETVEILANLIPTLSRKANIALEQVNNPKAWLTDREHEVLNQLILGHSVRVIAEHLERSAHTVHDHVKNLHKKLGASSRGELIAKALGHTCDSSEANCPAPSPIVLTGNSQLSELKPVQTKLHARALNKKSPTE